jgi:N-acyl-D-aspartate/D-glutamate deacylase
VGVQGDRIAAVGRIQESGREEIDAEGHVVSPGFIDLHTHMDAQVCWDPLGTCSSWHGVTSVVMGNCGFTLAPSREGSRELVVRNLERAEDIAAEAMAEGVSWNWESYPEYLDALEALPKGIHYGGFIGHSALRTYTMGERAFEEAANADDLDAMAREVRNAVQAGALGFTTSRTENHQTSDDRPVASRMANWDEVRHLVRAVGEAGGGIFEIANEDVQTEDEAQADYLSRLEELAVETGVTITYGVGSSRHRPESWHPWMAVMDRAAARGGHMVAQVHARPFNVVLSFEANLPFDGLAEWKPIRALPLEEQKKALRDPAVRARLIKDAHEGSYGNAIGAEARKPDYDWVFLMQSPLGNNPSLAQLARERNADPVELMIDLALESELQRFFIQPFANEVPDQVLTLMKHPRSVVTFSDSGAHVSQIMDSSIPTHVLAHWVREQQALTLEEAVRMLSFEGASAYGFHDRGLLREGMQADIAIFDPERIAPALPTVDHDLPGGARRLKQRAEGMLATVVAGETLLRDGKHTGALPGRVIRGPVARRSKA